MARTTTPLRPEAPLARVVSPEQRLREGKSIFSAPIAPRPSRSGPDNTRETQGDFKILDHTDLVETRNVGTKFLAGPIFPAGIPMMLVGPPGHGKTTLSEQAGMEIACGVSNLGLTIPEPLPVVFFEFEDSEEITMRRYQAYLKSLPDEAHYSLRSNFQVRVPGRAPMPFSRVVRNIHGWAEDLDTRARGGGLVVVDTLQAVFTGDENSSEAARDFWAETSQICREYKITVVFLHHIRKAFANEAARANTLERVRGSSAHVASARSVIEMSPMTSQGGARRSKISVIKINGGPPGVSMVVEQDPETGLWRLPSVGSGCDRATDRPPPSGEPEDSMSPAQRKVLEGLGRTPAPSREELVSELFATEVKGSTRLRSHIRFLRLKGLVTETDQLTPLGEQVLRNLRP